MRWMLFRVVLLSAGRGLAPALARNPLLAGAGGLAVAAAPAAAVWAGSKLAGPFGEASADPSFLRTTALAVAVTAVVAGASVSILAPGPSLLGPQVAAAPRHRRDLATGAVLGPACAAGAALALLLACFAVPMGGGDGLALVLVAAAGGAIGAPLGEGVRLVAAGDPVGAVPLAATAGLWLAAGILGRGSAAAGPAAAVDAPLAALVLPGVSAAGLGLWLAACGRARPDHAPARAARLRRLPKRAAPALAVASARRISRHPELRLLGLTAVALPLAASSVGVLAWRLPGSSAALICSAVTLSAAALYPAAAQGLARESTWLLAAAPRRAPTLGAAAAAGGVLAAGALLAASTGLALPLGAPGASALLQLEAAAALVLGCAAAAGAVVPWQRDRVLQQLASYGAVLALVVAAWLAVGRLVPSDAADAVGLALGNVLLLLGLGVAAGAAR